MRDRQSIIGFTEAELGFFVAILLFAFLVEHRAYINAKPPPQNVSLESDKSHARIKELESLLSHSLKRRSELASQNKDLLKEIKELTGVRSHQKPSCTEKRLEKGFLFDVTVEGANSFVIGDKLTDLDGLLNSVESRLENADREGCVESIRVFYSDKVSTPESLAARKALQRRFYITEPGREED